MILESNDGYNLPETEAPTVFSRAITEFMTFDDTGLKLEELPKPTLWRVLILPLQPKKMTASGIALPSIALEAESHLQYMGQVLALGPLAGCKANFQNPDWSPEKYDVPRYLWDIKPGDWIMFGRYAGARITFNDTELRMLNDDEIIGKIDAPDGYRVYL